ncbi:MAG: PilZ domain-containing protein [Chloroflexota bacterium]
MNTERRRSKRFQVVDLAIHTTDPDENIGKVVNLSEGGLLLVSDVELPNQEVVAFQIRFPHTVNGEINFDFDATVVWCHPNTMNTSKFSVGLQFAENPDLQTIFIQNMIKVFSAE